MTLNSWIDSTRRPTASTRLLVDVGPGTFFGQFICGTRSNPITPYPTSYSGFVTFRGSGRETTILKNQTTASIRAPVLVTGCQKIAFEDITLEGNRYGIAWADGGSSTWTNVNVIAGPQRYAFGWYEGSDALYCDTSGGQGVHYWFGSNIQVISSTIGAPATNNTAVGYNSACGQTWFYGGEITVNGSSDGSPPARYQAAVAVSAAGEFQGFGSLLRSFSGPIVGGSNPTFNALAGAVGLAGVLVGIDLGGSVALAPGGHFHLHGGNLTADASGATPSGLPPGVTPQASNATSLVVLQDGIAHTPGASFVVRAGTGATPYRLRNTGGVAISPFVWQASVDPPTGHHGVTGVVVQSDLGHDLYIETDCGSAASCSNVEEDDVQPHLMISDFRCGEVAPGFSPWFDVVTRACRLP